MKGMINEDEKIRGRGHCCSLVPELCRMWF